MKIDRYEVLCREDGSIFRLGHGRNSSSYKALDLDLRSPVVLKVIRPEFLEDEEARKRFLREARAAALLRHPNVAAIFRLGEEDGMCFYAREFIEGETLETKVRRDGAMGAAECLNVALQVAQALVSLKKLSMVHRDIKPSNLMITPEGLIKIIDFGLTKSSSGGQGSGLESITLSGFVGTPDYASPEQLNEEDLDTSSDVYSLGCTLWFLLKGQPPFRGATARVMTQHLQSSPPFEELSEFPPCIVHLLAYMLEKDQAKRPASPSQLVAEIESCIAALKGEPMAAGAMTVSRRADPLVEPPAAIPARMPTNPMPERRFQFAEILVGAIIAVAIYVVLSRPVEPATPAPQPTRGAATEGSVDERTARTTH